MNRRERKARESRSKNQTFVTPRHVVERAEKEGYALFEIQGEGWERCKRIMNAILTELDGASAVDGFFILTRLSALMAARGFRSKVDTTMPLGRESYLKNCAEQYDGFMLRALKEGADINSEGGQS